MDYRNMFDLTGKKALVTGSTQGIGFALAECLAAYGAEVFINGATSVEKCEAACARIAGKTHPVLADLSKPDCADKLYELTGDVDIMIHNASIQLPKPWLDTTLEDFEIQVNTNLRSGFLLCQKYSPAMVEKRWGRLILVGSVQQFVPHKNMPIYAATKQAQISLIMNLGKQLAPYGVTMNGLCPGVIATPRNDKALSDPVYSKKVMEGIPMGYAGQPYDMAGAALLLCSEAGRYITGSDFVVDGGMKL